MSKTLNLLIRDLERIQNISNCSKYKIYLLIFKYVFISSNNYRPIFFYRILSNHFSYIVLIISRIVTSFRIPYTAQIGGGLYIPHSEGIVFHGKSIIGDNATILQGVTIGCNVYKSKNGRITPIIGDNVLIGAGAKILGPVKIGDNSMIGANAVVINDIPKDSVAVGAPAKVVKEVVEPFHLRGFTK